MPKTYGDEQVEEQLLGLWIAEDKSKALVVWAEGGGLKVNVFRGLGPQTHVTGRPAKRQPDGSALTELGEPGMGTTYTLRLVVRGEDGHLRRANPDDDADSVRVLGEHGASFYEAVMGPWDDFVEDLNAADAWAMPATLYRRPTDADHFEFYDNLSECH